MDVAEFLSVDEKYARLQQTEVHLEMVRTEQSFCNEQIIECEECMTENAFQTTYSNLGQHTSYQSINQSIHPSILDMSSRQEVILTYLMPCHAYWEHNN